MTDKDLDISIVFLFNRDFNVMTTNEEEKELKRKFSELTAKYGSEKTFGAIDRYMRTRCLNAASAKNFAKWFHFYGCSESKMPDNPFKFLAYLYYRLDMKPWEHNAITIMDTLAYELFYSEKDKSRDPFWGGDYIPEKDPEIIAEAEKLKNRLEKQKEQQNKNRSQPA